MSITQCVTVFAFSVNFCFRGAYLYRRERKKHSRKTSEPVAHSSEDGSSGSPARMDTDDGQEPTSSSEEESSADEESVPVELTNDLRKILEQDYFLINTKNKVSALCIYSFIHSFKEVCNFVYNG